MCEEAKLAAIKDHAANGCGGWFEDFVKHTEIKNAQDIQRATHAALRTGVRTSVSDHLQSPRETVLKGSADHEDCAVLAIALAQVLKLPYELKVKKHGRVLVLHLSVDGLQILPD